MVLLLCKWWLFFQLTASSAHPFYVSVTEINHNASEKSLEVAVKIFTDDFENALKKVYNRPADLVNAANHEAMDSLVSDYIRKHLLVKADGKTVSMKYLGFERESEAVWSYLEVTGIPTPPKRIDISNKLLYDYIDKQINMMHITVNGKRKSGKLGFPDAVWSAVF